MKYKALFLDLDGTTVKNAASELPSQKVTEAINRVREKIHVCIATGRGLWEVETIFDHLQLTGFCVLLNGVQIYDPEKKKIIKEISLKKEILPELFQLLNKYELEKIYRFDGNPESVYKIAKKPQKILSLWIPELKEDLVNQIIQDLSKIPKVAAHKVFSLDLKSFAIEISDSEATKLHGIVEISKLLNINTHEMIGVGDAYNDFPLLMACGLKIAMGNAVPELKAIADFIAPPVEEDGVATVIEKFILPSNSSP